MKPQAGNDKPLSKTALKNQRKHEAKKAAKQEARNEKSPDLAPTPAPQSTPRNTISQSTSGDPEIDKKIKNLKKKLKAIEQLKEQAAAGKQLEKISWRKFKKRKPFSRSWKIWNWVFKDSQKPSCFQKPVQTHFLLNTLVYMKYPCARIECSSVILTI